MATFIEDYNTATMPSDKYYNLEVSPYGVMLVQSSGISKGPFTSWQAHERRLAMIRAGESVEEEGRYDFLADEAAAKASFKAKRRLEESSREAPAQWQSKGQLEAVSRQESLFSLYRIKRTLIFTHFSLSFAKFRWNASKQPR